MKLRLPAPGSWHFRTRLVLPRACQVTFYPMQGFAPPQEPGTWNLAGTCTLVNTPHATT